MRKTVLFIALSCMLTSYADDNVTKNPSLKESWRKIVTLKLDELSSDDIANIVAPIIVILVISGTAYIIFAKKFTSTSYKTSSTSTHPAPQRIFSQEALDYNYLQDL